MKPDARALNEAINHAQMIATKSWLPQTVVYDTKQREYFGTTALSASAIRTPHVELLHTWLPANYFS